VTIGRYSCFPTPAGHFLSKDESAKAATNYLEDEIRYALPVERSVMGGPHGGGGGPHGAAVIVAKIASRARLRRLTDPSSQRSCLFGWEFV